MAGLVPAIHVFVGGSVKTWMPGTSPGMTARYKRPLVAAVLVVEHLESFLELRRDRHAELLAGRQPRDEPFVVERNQVAARTQLLEGALDHGLHLRLTLAEHDAVG